MLVLTVASVGVTIFSCIRQKWSARSAENSLLWPVAGDYWRSAIAPYDNNYKKRPNEDPAEIVDTVNEILKRRELIN